jgi:cell wall-associated NlpC family hydrolase
LPPDRVAALDALSRTFVLPELSTWQQSILSRGLRFVGFPYVWAGSSERPQRLWSATAPGGLVDAPAGFDCSGFLWRVFKLEAYEDAPQLATVLRGRTTYDMSGEVPTSLRVGFDALQPGDVLFFGARGTRSKPSEVGHSGMYVGEGWFVHSSSNGVTLQPLLGWYADRFAWARRPLAEAGLAG